jgi:hypothetical protein
MSIDTIARALRARDRELAEHKALASVKCFGCGASFVYRGPHAAPMETRAGFARIGAAKTTTPGFRPMIPTTRAN